MTVFGLDRPAAGASLTSAFLRAHRNDTPVD
jgi:hypothetical protein